MKINNVYAITTLVFASMLSGCSAISTVGSAMSVATDLYCSAPKKARQVNRAVVGKAVSPHAVSIKCDGD